MMSTRPTPWMCLLLLAILVIEVLALAPATARSLDDGMPAEDLSSADDLTRDVNTAFIVRSALAKGTSHSRPSKAESRGTAQQGVIDIHPGAKVRGPIVLQAKIVKSIAIAKKR